jgi:hypothetical protein
VTETFAPKLVAPGEGRTVMLFGVRFSYKVVSADSGGRLAVLEVEIPPATRGAGKNGARNRVRPSCLLNTASGANDHAYGPCWRCRTGLYAS